LFVLKSGWLAFPLPIGPITYQKKKKWLACCLETTELDL
jgi:hypothetical protein